VEYVDSDGNDCAAFATREVILAAGTLQTAKILYNSGIGPESVLNAFDIPPRVVNPMIGQKIRNHQRIMMMYNDPTLLNPNFFNYPSSVVQYATTGLGFLEGKESWNVQMQINPSSPFPDAQATVGAVAGSTPSDLYSQQLTLTLTLNINLYANATLNLTSDDPLAPTFFTTNIFAVPEDAMTVAKGIIEVRRIMSFWNGTLNETSPGPAYVTVDDLIPWVKRFGTTACHYYSSVPMGIDSSFPVDPKMKLRGIADLRIVGPPIVPNHVFLGMQALALMLGEKGTDLIKADYPSLF